MIAATRQRPLWISKAAARTSTPAASFSTPTSSPSCRTAHGGMHLARHYTRNPTALASGIRFFSMHPNNNNSSSSSNKFAANLPSCPTEFDLDAFCQKHMELPEQDFVLGCSFLHQVALGTSPAILQEKFQLQDNPRLFNFRDYDRRVKTPFF